MDRADRLRAALRAAIQEKPTADVHQTYLSITSAPEFFAAAELCNDDSAFATAAAKLLADYVVVMSNFKDACLTIEDLYRRFGSKIRSTVRNYPKISEHEIDDVEQIVYAQAIEKRWLNQYTGKTKFTTFIYTYVRQAIQNYINIRDSAGRVSESGTRRYYPLSDLLPADVAEDSFLDFINKRYNGGDGEPNRCDALLDSEDFINKCRQRFVSTLLGDVPVYDIICGLMSSDGTRPEIKERELWPGEKEVMSRYGISAEWLQRVVELLRIFYSVGVDAAEAYLERSFFR